MDKINVVDEAHLYIKRKFSKHKQNLDNKPFSKRERRLMYFAFIAGFNHRYWKEKESENS